MGHDSHVVRRQQNEGRADLIVRGRGRDRELCRLEPRRMAPHFALAGGAISHAGVNSLWQNPRGVRPAMHPARTTPLRPPTGRTGPHRPRRSREFHHRLLILGLVPAQGTVRYTPKPPTLPLHHCLHTRLHSLFRASAPCLNWRRSTRCVYPQIP